MVRHQHRGDRRVPGGDDRLPVEAHQRRAGGDVIALGHEELEALAAHVDGVDADVDEDLQAIVQLQAHGVAGREGHHDLAVCRCDDGVAVGVDRGALAHLAGGEGGVGDLRQRQQRAAHRRRHGQIHGGIRACIGRGGGRGVGDGHGGRSRSSRARGARTGDGGGGGLLDEPFSALDVNLKSAIERDLISILKDYKGIVLYVTHDISEAYRICDEIIVYDKGTACAKSNKHDLFNFPKSITEARLTGCSNVFKGIKTNSNTIYAKNLGYEFKVNATLPDNISYIGIRSHNIITFNINDINEHNLNIDDNIHKFKIVNIIENPFSNTLILQNPDSTFTDVIEAEVQKDNFNYKINNEIYAQLKEDHLFYF